MFKDKKPGKWLLLAVLFLIVLMGILLFMGLNARADNDTFLPIKNLKTPSGISVWIVEDHSLPISAIKFMFLNSGSANDPDQHQGLTRLLSNTMDEGAGDMDSQSFQKALSDHSITLMFDADRDSFGGTLKTLTRHQEKAFELLTLAINAPRFDTEAVARMRDSNLSRIKSSLSDPEWMAARLINGKAFEGHPYAKNSGGTLSSLPSITPDKLRAFKKSYLTQDRLLIVAAGDIKPETLGPAIDKIFGNLPKTGPSVTIPDAQPANAGQVYLFEQPIPQTMIEAILPSFDRNDKDYYALQILNYIYGGAGFGSRLMETAREQRGLTYGIYSSVQDYRHMDVLGISTSTKNESAKEMLSIIHDEMDKLQSTTVSAKELTDAKSYITGSMPLTLDSTEDIASMVLGLRADGLPIDYLDHYADYINAVTPADLQRVANRVLNPDNLVTVLVGKPQKIPNAIIIKELPNVR